MTARHPVMPAEWFDDRDNVADLIRWLDATCQLRGISDAIYVVEKPWKFTTDYDAMRKHERALEADAA